MRSTFSLLCLAGMALGGAAALAGAAHGAPARGTGFAPEAGGLEALIVGGSRVPDGRWPDAAVVYYAGEWGCTGTLIAPDLVLTAGHCIDGSIDKVKIGVTNVDQAGEEISVARAVAYPSWETDFDVGLLMLERDSVAPPRRIAAACAADAHLDTGAAVTMAGFGAIDIYGEEYPGDLREMQATVWDHDCSEAGGCMPTINPGGELTAGAEGANPCFGDSGGPLYLHTPEDDLLVGVISRSLGEAGAPCQGGGIFPRVDAVLGWIESESGRALSTEDCGDPADPPEEPGDSPDPGDRGDPGDSGDSGGPGGATARGGCSVGGAGGSELWLFVPALLLGLRGRRRDRAARRGAEIALACAITLTASACSGNIADPEPDDKVDTEPESGEPEDTPPDDETPPTGDFCKEQGWYGDGTCDADCPMPDPDCDGDPSGDPNDPSDPGGDPNDPDFCEEQGWYGDGYCDADCPMPDPDCDGDPSGDPNDPGDPGGSDFCEEQGWYGDGYCDADCPQPDPDCNGDQGDPGDPGGGDFCEEQGWYGDGLCDPDCPQPDPDCE